MKIRIEDYPSHFDAETDLNETLGEFLSRSGFSGATVRNAQGILMESRRLMSDFLPDAFSFPVPASRPGIDGVLFIDHFAARAQSATTPNGSEGDAT